MHIYQIYYDENTRRACASEYTMLDNSGKCTVWAENSVIRTLYEANLLCPDPRMSGVFSWKFWTKRPHIKHYGRMLDNLARDCRTPIMSFWGKSQNVDPFHQRGLESVFWACLESAGLPRVPKFARNSIIFCNYVLTSRQVWADYVENYLIPIMDATKHDTELARLMWGNIHYCAVNPELEAQFRAFADAEHPNADFIPASLNYWPFHAFVAERLWSYYVTATKTPVTHV